MSKIFYFIGRPDGICNRIEQLINIQDWLDFYYLTKPEKYILMCSNFSSYSICASILGNKKLLVLKNSLKSNLSRYNANISIIDE